MKTPVASFSFIEPGITRSRSSSAAHLRGYDPVCLELNRLRNDVRDKDRTLREALSEIRSLKILQRSKEKAVEELTHELTRADAKVKMAESVLESKNLEIKRCADERRAALAAQSAAEATVRRLRSAKREDDSPPIESILSPLDAELKLAKREVVKLQDDNKALERLTKSKEIALLDAEKSVQSALAKSFIVDELQNKNQALLKQIDISKDENKVLDKMYKLKVAEVSKLTQTVQHLEEVVLAGGAAANAVRDYQRKVQELNDERRTLEREVARAKVSANRVATVVANEWKDEYEKLMPVTQWLRERHVLQGEMQKLREKLVVAERTAKAEAQLKEKFRLRFEDLEEKCRLKSKMISEEQNGRFCKLQSQQVLVVGYSIPPKDGAFTSESFNPKLQSNTGAPFLRDEHSGCSTSRVEPTEKRNAKFDAISNEYNEPCAPSKHEDCVSGLLYDMVQREVLALRKSGQEKSRSLKDKDEVIEALAKKVETLNRAMEVKTKMMRREVAAMENEMAALGGSKEQDKRGMRLSNAR